MKKAINKKKKNPLIVLILSILIVLLALITLMLLLNENKSNNNLVNAKIIECVKDSDCLIVRGSCCSCENGGAPQCIPKTSFDEVVKSLEKCSRDGACFNVDCGKISCSCINNVCTGKPL